MIISFFIYLVKVCVCLTLFYGLYYFVLRKETFFQFNRCYLVLTLLLSFGIPYGEMTLNNFEESAAAIYLGLDEQIVNSVGDLALFERAKTFAVDKVMLFIYLAGVLVFTLKMLLNIFYVVHLRMWSRVEKKGNYTLVKIEKAHPVFSFFNMIFWNDSLRYSEEEAQQVLLHELVHVRQKHSIDSLLVEFANALLWFFPFIYWVKKSLKNTHEFIVDAHLYKTQKYQLSYIDLLLKEAREQHDYALPIVHTFFDNQLKSRLKMLNNNERKSNKLKLLTALPLTLLLVFFFCCNQLVTADAFYENEHLDHPKSGQIFQACDIDDEGMITLDTGEKVTVDEMKAIVVERRRADGDIVTKNQVSIVSREELKKRFQIVK